MSTNRNANRRKKVRISAEGRRRRQQEAKDYHAATLRTERAVEDSLVRTFMRFIHSPGIITVPRDVSDEVLRLVRPDHREFAKRLWMKMYVRYMQVLDESKTEMLERTRSQDLREALLRDAELRERLT